MIGDRRVAIRPGVEPDLVRTSGLPVEREPELPEAPSNTPVGESCQPTHSVATDHQGMIEGSPGLAQCRPLLAVGLGLKQLGADIASDLQSLGHGAALSYQAGDVVLGSQIYAFGQPFNVQVDDPFHLGPTQSASGNPSRLCLDRRHAA